MPTTPPALPTQPSAIDLTSIAVVNSYAEITGTADNELIQLCITAASAEFIWRTGRGNDGEFPSASPFVTPQTYDEWYDGNGNARLFLRNWPIQSVTSVTVDTVTVPVSTSAATPGYVIDQGKRSIAIRHARPPFSVAGSFWTPSLMRSLSNYLFNRGIQNVEVQYTAGFSQVPWDVVKACTQLVAINYKRRSWIDLASETLSAGGGVSGTTRYRDWAIPPEVQQVISYYSRTATA